MCEIIHHPEEKRFVTVVEKRKAYVEYEIDEHSLNITHTIVPISIGGRGIAGKLVEAAYNYAEANHLNKEATCSYAVAWLKKHEK